MVDEKKIAWLAGLWDGEGSISLFKNREKNGNIKFRPTINIVNTNEIIINEVLKICDDLGVGLQVIKKDVYSENHCQSYELQTSKFKTIQKLLNILLPYLVGKRAQAEIILRFINKRLEYMEKGIPNQKNRYDLEECEMLEKQIRSLNKRGPKPQRLNAENEKSL